MKYFLEMVEHVQRGGLIHYLDEGPKGRTVDAKHFFEMAEKAENLVFMPINKEPIFMEGDSFIKYDAPFPIYSLEVLGGNVTSPSYFDTKAQVWIHCFLAWEVEPNKFGYYTYATRNGQKFVFSTNTLNRVAKEFMDRLNREEMGVQKVRQRIKVGLGKEKRIHTVRRIVYVKPKSAPREILGAGGTIDWTHRWAVRGHWRNISGLGKDREGKYCVNNHTWVTEYEKGPSDAPLIKKTRIIE